VKKCLSLLIIVGFLCTGLGASHPTTMPTSNSVQTVTIAFSNPQLPETDGAIALTLAQATSYTKTPGQPMLPVVTHVFTLPFRTQVNHVSVRFSGTRHYAIVLPLAVAVPSVVDTTDMTMIDPSASDTSSTAGFSYHLAAGCSGNTIATYLAVNILPTSVNPKAMTVSCAAEATITIDYTLPAPTPAPLENYSLLVVAPEKFAPALEPLVAHKISHGVSTRLVTREDVCNGTYFPTQGRDCAEKLKYFIKNAQEQWNTTYVLLVGGRKGGIRTETWWMPVRYSHLNDGGEASYLSDLYFEDLYNANGSFSSWDTNNNGVFAEWTNHSKDILDMYPDVFVGRLPCTSVFQVKTIVKKIIAYEDDTAGEDWFYTFIGVAGDTYPEDGDVCFEGERATNMSYQCLKPLGFIPVFLWTSLGTLTDKQDIIDAINEGAGFVHFSGHGNPAVWSTHAPYNTTFIDGPTTFDMHKLRNGGKLPVVIVGGCHNAQYNTNLCNIILGVLRDGLHYFSMKKPVGRFWYNEWVPRCWAWNMEIQPQGGCIGIVANTGLGYGQPGADTVNVSGRFLEWLFFKSYADGNHRLGETHAFDLIYYMNEYPPMADMTDCKIVQEWGLLGDPSLQIGGFSS